jgi:hypothetical protein
LIITIAISSLPLRREIASIIRMALQWHTSVNDDKIEVKVDGGWVYLEVTVTQDKPIQDRLPTMTETRK